MTLLRWFRPPAVETGSTRPAVGWAVVELRRRRQPRARGVRDRRPAPEEAARGSQDRCPPRAGRWRDSSALDARIGLLQAADGAPLRGGSLVHPRHPRIVRRCRPARLPGTAGPGPRPTRAPLLRAKDHADLALALPGADDDPGARHARLALAWVHVERDEHDEAALLPRPGSSSASDRQQEPWLDTARLLLEARLLAATRPDVAPSGCSPKRPPPRGTTATADLSGGWRAAAIGSPEPTPC